MVIPLLLIAGDLLFGLGPDRGGNSEVTIRVSDASNGTKIQSATVALGGDVKQTDVDGAARFSHPGGNSLVQVVAAGFQPVYGSYGGDAAADQAIALRPVTIAAAPANPTPAANEAPPQTAPTLTPALTATAAAEQTSIPSSTGDASTADAVASGIVVDQQGEPIKGALVAAGGKYTRTKSDGRFTLKEADVSKGLIVNAPGYARQDIAAGTDLNVQLERMDIKAAYLNGNEAGNAAFVDDLIALINRTELNAVVIDIKEGDVFYDTQVKFFRDADAVAPTYDPAELVKKFEDAGIYTIARLVVFNDPVVAEAYPELAIQDDNGGLWRGSQGAAWVNPFNKELWQPNIDLALESIGFGFDEVQYDYIRFPSDGDLTTADFGAQNDYSEEGRVGAIVDFLKMSHDQIARTGAMLAVDIFGIVAVYPDDQGIGQRLKDVAPVVDYVCPMIYPSHFDSSSIDVGGEPNAHPYETISLSVSLALQKMPGMELKLRPWLQDFTLGDPPYGPDEVRTQINAAEELGTSGWLLWNAASEFTEDALEPQ